MSLSKDIPSFEWPRQAPSRDRRAPDARRPRLVTTTRKHSQGYCQLKHFLTKMVTIRGTRNVADLNIGYPKMANFV